MKITTADAARIIGVGENTVRELAKQGKIGSAVRIGSKRSIIYSAYKIAAFLGTTREEIERRLCSE